MREDEFDGHIEADIAVDDLAALVDDEERGNRVDAIELSGLAFSDRTRREKAGSFHSSSRTDVHRTLLSGVGALVLGVGLGSHLL